MNNANPGTTYCIPDTVWQIGSINQSRNRLGAARLSYHQIGQGSARAVFAMGVGDTVLKVARNRKGIAQNIQEASPEHEVYYGTMLVPVLASDPKGIWLIQQRAQPVSEPDIYRFLATSEGRRFERNAWLFAKLNGFNEYDLTKPANIGRLNGQLLIFDYGLTRAIYDQFYQRSAPRAGG